MLKKEKFSTQSSFLGDYCFISGFLHRCRVIFGDGEYKCASGTKAWGSISPKSLGED